MQAHPKYRADIDGLRAIAVLSVVGFHVTPNWPAGGFTGVDILFVISGFLITNIIVGGLRRGSFDFGEFYARRIKRIFPALILVMAASYAFGWVALFPEEYQQLGKHVASGAGFVSNFIFWNEVDYFDNAAATKPLLHLWSLAIEEQFYILWPMLLFVAFRRNFSLLALSVAIALLSFAINVAGIRWDATATFYSPLSRFWELMLGGILALRQIQQAGTSTTARSGFRNLQAGLGLALIAIAFAMFQKSQPFPGWRALVPALGAFLLIAAGPGAWVNRTLLSNRILVWFGLISYPLYLWHWPLLSFAHVVESGVLSTSMRVAIVALAVLLAWLTYVLVERPIRGGGRVPAKVATLASIMGVLAAVGYGTFANGGLASRPSIEANLQRHQALVWKEEWNRQDACTVQYPVYGRYCLLSAPASPPTVALIGDSHANHLFFGLSEHFQARGENLLLLGERLPFRDLETGPVGTQALFVHYKEVMNAILDRAIQSPSIKTIILASAGVAYVRERADYHLKLASQPDLRTHEKIFEEALRGTLKELVATGKQIIFVYDTPELGFDPKSCLNERPFRLTNNVRSPCAVARGDFDRRTATYHRVVGNVLREFPAVKSFAPHNQLCDQEYCWAMRDGTMLYRDENHLSYEGSLFVGRAFEAIVP